MSRTNEFAGQSHDQYGLRFDAYEAFSSASTKSARQCGVAGHGSHVHTGYSRYFSRRLREHRYRIHCEIPEHDAAPNSLVNDTPKAERANYFDAV